jgi:fibronectin type 3 domain-containing protein
MRIQTARFVNGEDAGRFRFEIITSGVEALALQATGGEGYIDLSWIQDDFDLLAGYNLYRSTSEDGTYQRINSVIIPDGNESFRDLDVAPGQIYYYKFQVVKTDMGESSDSNITSATPLDTIAPVISHTPIATAQPNLSLTIPAAIVIGNS